MRKRREGVTKQGVIREGVTLGTEEAAKLLMVIKAMDKEVRGLDGKVNLLTMTRYGVSGQTLAEIKPMLGGG